MSHNTQSHTFPNHFSTPESANKAHIQQSRVSKFFQGRTPEPRLPGAERKREWGKMVWGRANRRKDREGAVDTPTYKNLKTTTPVS